MRGKATGREPVVLELEEGRYFWCQCGESLKQPFCDGRHKGSDFGPILVEVKEGRKKVLLCQCRKTANPPYCDGSHVKD